MSESDASADAVPDAALAAVEAHPEAVAAFLDRLGLVNDLLDAVSVATEAADDEMVQGLAGTTSSLAASADGLATPEMAGLAATVGENAADLDSAMETMLRLEQSGSLAELAALGDALTFMTDAMDDEMVTTLAGMGGDLGGVADAATEPAAARGMESMVVALGEAADADPERVGMRGMLGAMREPEVQAGMGFLVAVARALGSDLEARQDRS